MREGWRLMRYNCERGPRNGKPKPSWCLVLGDPARMGCQFKRVNPRTARRLINDLSLTPIDTNHFHEIYWHDFSEKPNAG